MVAEGWGAGRTEMVVAQPGNVLTATESFIFCCVHFTSIFFSP